MITFVFSENQIDLDKLLKIPEDKNRKWNDRPTQLLGKVKDSMWSFINHSMTEIIECRCNRFKSFPCTLAMNDISHKLLGRSGGYAEDDPHANLSIHHSKLSTALGSLKRIGDELTDKIPEYWMYLVDDHNRLMYFKSKGSAFATTYRREVYPDPLMKFMRVEIYEKSDEDKDDDD